ncbi:hypothetical protein HWV62_32555 [Athelia sp. TMB]|nr:hypothetical protein HWV62_32555 [Athelia sp. TMB]
MALIANLQNLSPLWPLHERATLHEMVIPLLQLRLEISQEADGNVVVGTRNSRAQRIDLATFPVKYLNCLQIFLYRLDYFCLLYIDLQKRESAPEDTNRRDNLLELWARNILYLDNVLELASQWAHEENREPTCRVLQMFLMQEALSTDHSLPATHKYVLDIQNDSVLQDEVQTWIAQMAADTDFSRIWLNKPKPDEISVHVDVLMAHRPANSNFILTEAQVIASSELGQHLLDTQTRQLKRDNVAKRDQGRRARAVKKGAADTNKRAADARQNEQVENQPDDAPGNTAPSKRTSKRLKGLQAPPVAEPAPAPLRRRVSRKLPSTPQTSRDSTVVPAASQQSRTPAATGPTAGPSNLSRTPAATGPAASQHRVAANGLLDRKDLTPAFLTEEYWTPLVAFHYGQPDARLWQAQDAAEYFGPYMTSRGTVCSQEAELLENLFQFIQLRGHSHISLAQEWYTSGQ